VRNKGTGHPKSKRDGSAKLEKYNFTSSWFSSAHSFPLSWCHFQELEKNGTTFKVSGQG
jgi:hypothetical protein